MREAISVERGGIELLAEAPPLWEALYDRHLEYGAAGLATIARGHSWPRRLAHYQHIFAERPHPVVLLARLDGQAIGYALSYDEEHLNQPAVVLETLSLLPAARGRGLGTRLMDMIDQQARERGATHGIVDVVHGNTPPSASTSTRASRRTRRRGCARSSRMPMTMPCPTTSGTVRGASVCTSVPLPARTTPGSPQTASLP